MNGSNPMSSIPASFDQQTCIEILNRTKLLLTPMLPGCTARRYDFPLFENYSPIELCFADRGPIVPKLVLTPVGYCSSLAAAVDYASMLRDARNLGIAFSGGKVAVSARFDSGSEAMVSALHAAIAEVDFAEMIAAGSIERILAEHPRYPAPWPNLHLALCAVYQGRDQEARGLLQDSLRYAREDGRPGYANVIAEAEAYLTKLEADADALRQELISTMDSNWSHFKTVNR